MGVVGFLQFGFGVCVCECELVLVLGGASILYLIIIMNNGAHSNSAEKFKLFLEI